MERDEASNSERDGQITETRPRLLWSTRPTPIFAAAWTWREDRDHDFNHHHRHHYQPHGRPNSMLSDPPAHDQMLLLPPTIGSRWADSDQLPPLSPRQQQQQQQHLQLAPLGLLLSPEYNRLHCHHQKENYTEPPWRGAVSMLPSPRGPLPSMSALDLPNNGNVGSATLATTHTNTTIIDSAERAAIRRPDKSRPRHWRASIKTNGYSGERL